MVKFKAILVDDERLARRELRSLLKDYDQIEIVGEADDLTESVKLIETLRPDVVFLDIQLRNEDGFDLHEKTSRDFRTIFVTAFDEFAIRAFEINALDYLMKPVNPTRLATAIGRLLDDESEKEEDKTRKLEIDDRFLLEMNERSHFLKISSISHIKAAGDYSDVFLKDGRHSLVEKPLAEWDVRLPEKHFTRIHRSTIINLNEIENMEMLFNRTMEVQLRNFRDPFTVSRRYATKLKEKFG